MRPRFAIFRLRQKSLVRGTLVSLVAFAATAAAVHFMPPVRTLRGDMVMIAVGSIAWAVAAAASLAVTGSKLPAQILRRGYSYNDGVAFTAARWPPWRQGMMYDAGLFFVAYQRDPRAGFIKIYQNMSKLDALNQFTTHTGGGLFACPAGVREGEFIGQRLFQPGA